MYTVWWLVTATLCSSTSVLLPACKSRVCVQHEVWVLQEPRQRAPLATHTHTHTHTHAHTRTHAIFATRSHSKVGVELYQHANIAHGVDPVLDLLFVGPVVGTSFAIECLLLKLVNQVFKHLRFHPRGRNYTEGRQEAI